MKVKIEAYLHPPIFPNKIDFFKYTAEFSKEIV